MALAKPIRSPTATWRRSRASPRRAPDFRPRADPRPRPLRAGSSARPRERECPWDPCGVPFAPELFSAPALQRVLDKYRRQRLRSVPFFDGLMTGEIDALVESFSG